MPDIRSIELRCKLWTQTGEFCETCQDIPGMLSKTLPCSFAFLLTLCPDAIHPIRPQRWLHDLLLRMYGKKGPGEHYLQREKLGQSNMTPVYATQNPRICRYI